MTTGAHSIERSVVSAYLVSIVAVAVAIVLVGGLLTTYVVVQRDDGHARALATAMMSELVGHDVGLDALVRHELDEQRWFRREIEVWRGTSRLGSTAPGRLQPWTGNNGCALARLDVVTRICTVKAPTLDVVVATPLAPILAAEMPLLVGIAAVAGVMVVVFALLSRRLVRRSLRPLRQFESRLASIGGGDRVALEWGAAEIDQLAATFNLLLARIDDAIAREHRFVSNAAHELRTPLTRLRGQIELVLAEPASDDARRRLGLAVRTCEELAGSTDALLALARDEREDQAVDLGEVAAEVVRGLPAKESGRVTVVTAEAMVRGDEVLLLLAARNLVDNALKYSDGAVEVRVAGGMLAVLDGGAGIAVADEARLRQPFERGHHGIRGTGLGLALVEHVAVLHDGELVLESTPTGFRAAMRLGCG